MVSPALTVPCFFFNDTATTEIYTLSLHDALPILPSLLVVTDAELLTVPQVADVVGEVMWTWKDAEAARPTSEIRTTSKVICHLPLVTQASMLQLRPELLGTVSETVTLCAVPAPAL